MQNCATIIFVASLIALSFANPAPDCPPGGHSHGYEYPAPAIQLSVGKAVSSYEGHNYAGITFTW